MATIKCAGEGCPATIQTPEELSPNARYTCREHTKRNEDKVRFQTHQFDKGLKRSAHPVGTTHIKRQGEVEDTDVEREIWGEIQELTKEKKNE
jgi:hypothetical protein